LKVSHGGHEYVRILVANSIMLSKQHSTLFRSVSFLSLAHFSLMPLSGIISRRTTFFRTFVDEIRVRVPCPVIRSYVIYVNWYQNLHMCACACTCTYMYLHSAYYNGGNVHLAKLSQTSMVPAHSSNEPTSSPRIHDTFGPYHARNNSR
jgi:hypothetical protein